MLQKRFIITIALITILLSILMSVGEVSQAAQSQIAPIRLQADTFVPALGDQPNIPPGLTIRGYAPGQRGYYIVQFIGPVQQAWKNEVEALGGEILAYIPDYAFKVRLNPAQAARVSGLDTVAWLGLFQPAYKINPDVTREGTNLYRVRLERGANRGQTISAVIRSGAEILSRDKDLLLIAAEADQLNDIAHVLDVAWIEDFLMPQKHNEYGAGSILGANIANANGYDGSTQIVAVADSGLGGGTASTAHADVPSNRVTAIYDWPAPDDPECYNAINDGAIDVDSGHGTHTALSVLSDGGAGGEGKGTAPAASLVFQAVEDYADMTGLCSLLYLDGYYLLGLPNDLRELYQQAYDAGARIHSNSWGSDAAGAYTLDSANTDEFIWNNPDKTITFSTGNAGIDLDANGEVDDDSMGSPATAKNAISVGASENDREGNWDCDTGLSYTNCSGQNSIFTYGSGWPADFPAGPVGNDPSAGNAQQMAAFSSRGPTDDGRIKPDVVAPGTWVLSGYSDLYQQGYDGSNNPQNGAWQYDGWGYPYNQNYKYMGGTSMANPIVAGAAAVVRDFYEKTDSHFASAALVKATLINSAVDLLDENNDGANDNDYPIPNSHEGWGRVDLASATDGSHVYVDEATGLDTGGSASYQYPVATAGSPFKVSLVWSDYASTEAAAQNLVNNLDLTVTAPDGSTQFKGNVFSGGWSQTGGSVDSINNVENVYVQAAAAGTWTVTVSGTNVPNGPQPFALVYGSADVPTVSPVASFSYTATGLNVLFTDESTTPGDGIDAWHWDFGDTYSSTKQNPPHDYQEPGTYTVTLTVTDINGEQDSTSQVIKVGHSHVGDFAGSSNSRGKSWTAVLWITIHDSFENPVTPATVEGFWSTDPITQDSCAAGLMNGESVCSVTLPSIDKKQNTVIFTVTGITNTPFTYNEAANHDDTTGGISIQINKDGTTEDPGTPGNQAPTADFTFAPSSPAPGQVITFTDISADPDGNIVSWDWDFGDGSDHSDQQHPTHSYLLDDSYVVTLTVTDDDGEADSTSQTVNVSDGSSGGITLTASGYKVKGVHHADLEWFDAPANVDIYRDTEKIVSGISLSTYTDNIGNKGAGSYTYKVCEAGSTTSCSNEATVNF